MVVRTGPQQYEIYEGTVTSCQLPNPDWMLYSDKFMVDMDNKKARAQNSIFRMMNIPLLFLPYVTHPVDSGGRQSGFLIPMPGYSSTKGFIVWRGVLLGDQPEHRSDGGGGVLLAAGMVAVGDVSLSGAGQ